MAICLITPPQSVPHEAATLNALFQHGLTAAHVRKPDWPAARVRELLSQVGAHPHPHPPAHHPAHPPAHPPAHLRHCDMILPRRLTRSTTRTSGCTSTMS